MSNEKGKMAEEQEIIPVKVYTDDFHKVEDFHECKPGNVLFYADVKLDLADGHFLYANDYKLARFEFFNNYFMDKNTRKDVTGVYRFRSKTMDTKEKWTPLLHYFYGNQDEAKEGFTKMILSEDGNYSNIESVLQFVESTGIVSVCNLFHTLFLKLPMLDHMEVYSIVRRLSPYPNSLNPVKADKQGAYFLKKTIISRIMNDFQLKWHQFMIGDVLRKLSILNADDFELTHQHFLGNAFQGTRYILFFLFCFNTQVIEGSEKKMEILNFFATEDILAAMHGTDLMSRCQEYSKAIISYCSLRLEKDRPQKRTKVDDSTSTGGFGRRIVPARGGFGGGN